MIGETFYNLIEQGHGFGRACSLLMLDPQEVTHFVKNDSEALERLQDSFINCVNNNSNIVDYYIKNNKLGQFDQERQKLFKYETSLTFWESHSTYDNFIQNIRENLNILNEIYVCDRTKAVAVGCDYIEFIKLKKKYTPMP